MSPQHKERPWFGCKNLISKKICTKTSLLFSLFLLISFGTLCICTHTLFFLSFSFSFSLCKMSLFLCFSFLTELASYLCSTHALTPSRSGPKCNALQRSISHSQWDRYTKEDKGCKVKTSYTTMMLVEDGVNEPLGYLGCRRRRRCRCCGSLGRLKWHSKPKSKHKS